jgi:carboxyl-terminal processing protease
MRREMMNFFQRDRVSRSVRSVTVLLLLVLVSAQGFADDGRYIKINRSIETFGRVYQEIISNYVDEIDPEQFMRAGIDGMLGALDPYTVYIDESGRDEVDILTTGRYGGVGITIGYRDNALTVTSIMDGYTAQKQGLMIGDRIVSIDNENIEGKSLTEVRSLVRGEPGSTVLFLVERQSFSEPLEFTLIRESIRVQNVRYADFIEEGLVYIRLDRFSRGAGGETRNALRELNKQHPVTGVILDLRNNAGGLLDAAVEVTNIFVPRGTLIVTTRGRTADSVRRYVATQEPLLPDVPLLVLINRNSASASEIVAGAIQDIDRGVLIGTRSFGKGLVQTVAHLASNSQLKITTSRYYTPSGRSIQTAEYLTAAPKGLFPVDIDSLHTEYKTAAGRSVRDGKGIDPDSLVLQSEPSGYVDELLRNAMLFTFVTNLVHEEKFKEDEPVLDDDLLDRFSAYLTEQKFEYRAEEELKIAELREVAERGNVGDQFMHHLTMLESFVQTEREHAFERYRDEIRRELRAELAVRYAGDKGRIRTELEFDNQFKAALDLIKDRPLYRLQLTAVE